MHQLGDEVIWGSMRRHTTSRCRAHSEGAEGAAVPSVLPASASPYQAGRSALGRGLHIADRRAGRRGRAFAGRARACHCIGLRGPGRRCTVHVRTPRWHWCMQNAAYTSSLACSAAWHCLTQHLGRAQAISLCGKRASPGI